MIMTKRIINAISFLACFTIIWIPFHFMIKKIMYGDKAEHRAKK